jgi:dTDP-4-dehydrorhamnose 3,5-epimerase
MSDFKPHGEINGIWSRTTTRHHDDRGFFSEILRLNELETMSVNFKQQNLSYSKKMVRRGMHAQEKQWQLITLVSGHVIDVLLDIRVDSSTFGKFASYELKHDSNAVNQLLVSPGIAHGFGVLSEDANMLYLSDRYYGETNEIGISCVTTELESAWPRNKWIESLRDKSFLELSEAKKTGILSNFTTKI